jgi:acyl-CoA synthetase (NDP forming)
VTPDKPLRVPVILDSRISDWHRQQLSAAGLAITSDGETIWRSLGHIARQARAAGTLRDERTARASAEDSASPPARPVRLPELEAFARLRAAGVPMVDTQKVHRSDELRSVCARFGYPVVLKGIVDGVVHKADEQLVHVDIWGDDEAVATWEKLTAAVGGRGGFVVVQPQLRGALAEMIVATRDDPQYGRHVMVGGGGKWVESDADVAWASAPVTAERAALLIRRTRVGTRLATKYPELFGPGGLSDVVAAISRVADECGDSVAEIEINPLIVRTEGVSAVDAVITLRGASA